MWEAHTLSVGQAPINIAFSRNINVSMEGILLTVHVTTSYVDERDERKQTSADASKTD